jgi:hypothetical protein
MEQPDAQPGSARAQPGRLADIAIRAALLTRADVRILTPEQAAKLDGGIGGLLRHT